MEPSLQTEYERVIREQRAQYKELKKLFAQEKIKQDNEEERANKNNIKYSNILFLIHSEQEKVCLLNYY